MFAARACAILRWGYGCFWLVATPVAMVTARAVARLPSATPIGVWSGTYSVSELAVTAIINSTGQAAFLRADGDLGIVAYRNAI